MRVLTIAAVFLFAFAAASAQSKFNLQPQGELRIDDYDDRIIAERPSFPDLTDRKTRVVRTIVNDETKVVRHPSGRIFMTYSNQYVKI